MADSQPFQPKQIYDYISSFADGMNSGISPLLLEKSQLAFSANATVRGGFASNRPPFTTKGLTFVWPPGDVQTAVEQGLFQGSGYYQPDSGPQSLIAQIGGRLFQFTVNGQTVTVTEITIPGDPNPASVTQVWMWQAENYMIVNDGISLPIFFDGTSSRRSFGPSIALGTTDAGPYTAVAIGSIVTVNLLAPYTGPFNVPVLMRGEYYQPIANTSISYNVTLTALYDIPHPLNIGDQVVIQPSIAGVLIAAPPAVPGSPFTAGGTIFQFPLTTAFTGPIGSQIILYGKIWKVVGIPGNSISAQPQQNGTIGVLNAGDQIQYASSSAPNIILGTLTAGGTSPGTGGSLTVGLSSPFTGTLNQIVYIGTSQFTIVALPSPPPGTALSMINLTDTATGNIVSEPIVSVPELPIARMGAYGMTQNYISLPDAQSFVISDVSRGPSGTQANNFRDAVLKIVDETFKGGNFAIPGAGVTITSITFAANLDVSLGQGACQIGTPTGMFSCIAPFDFSNPPATGPILTQSLIGTGPLAQDSTISVNSDTLFRSVTGLASLVIARREFVTWGNTPISQEMRRVIDLDNQSLLSYSSAIVFDNRELMTVSPQASSQGVFHGGLIALNLDPVSSLRGKAPSVYDGLWTGMNVLKLNTGIFNGSQRAFAFTFNVTLSKIELYELLPTRDAKFDNGTTPIQWSFETAAIFNGDVKSGDVFASLRDGEFAVDDVFGPVRFEVSYKSDQYPCWVPWHSFSICNAQASQQAAYFPRLGLGEPDAKVCNPQTDTPLRDGYTFQVRFQITGACRFLRARFAAVTQPIPKFQKPICDPICEEQS